jgi:hypothetical protein
MIHFEKEDDGIDRKNMTPMERMMNMIFEDIKDLKRRVEKLEGCK